MAGLRQEQIVAIAAALILGLLWWTGRPEEGAGSRGGRGSAGDGVDRVFESHAPPDVSLVLPDPDAPEPLLFGERSPFEPPRNTRPMPPLTLEEPPRGTLPALFPPPTPGPAVRHFGTSLRRDLVVRDVPGLFFDTDEDGVFDFALSGADDEGDSPISGTSLEDQLREMGFLDPEMDEEPLLTPDERAALLEGYKELYDWVDLNSASYPYFGRIENVDRYALKTPSGEADDVTFVRLVDWRTGEPPSSGSAPVTYARELIDDFGFARTFANEIELFLRELGDDVHPGNYSQVLAFADTCVRRRLDAPRALEVAEQLYRALADQQPDDLRPRLGLASCLEAGFRFEEAFALYGELDVAFPRRPEVAVRRGRLEERYLLTDAAEATYLEALRYDATSWEANQAYGELLLEQGRDELALEHLAKASQYVPPDPELHHRRIEVRLAHGRALLAAGQFADAHRVFVQARKADATSQGALAGQIAAMILDPTLSGTNGDALPEWLSDRLADDRPEEGVGFELLLAAGLYALDQGDHLLARDRLLEAARSDPLRASLAWRALSYLAEVTNNPAEAWRFVEQATEADPSDPWTRFQRARLLAQQDDLEGAAMGYQSALELELDYADALAARGELSFQAGAYEDAERYLERALSLEPRRADLLVLRGLNYLQLERVREAQTAFQAAKDADRTNVASRNGLAWCRYRLGDSDEALTQLGEVQEFVRNRPEEVAAAAWAARQAERISDHAQKEAWIDEFERTTLRNGWIPDESLGPIVTLVDGAVKIEGLFREGGMARVYRLERAPLFVSLEASVWVSSSSAVESGLHVLRKRGGRTNDVVAGVSVSRHKDGTLMWTVTRPGMPEDPVEVPWLTDFRTDQWVRLRIERHGDPADARVTISVDGTPIAENVKMPDLGRTQTDVEVGLYVRGEQARTAHVLMDDVEIVRRK